MIPGPVPLRINWRVMIHAATAVAAKMVRNQNRRLPSSTKGLNLPDGREEEVSSVDRDWAVAVAFADRPDARRTGEIQGRMA